MPLPSSARPAGQAQSADPHRPQTAWCPTPRRSAELHQPRNNASTTCHQSLPRNPTAGVRARQSSGQALHCTALHLPYLHKCWVGHSKVLVVGDCLCPVPMPGACARLFAVPPPASMVALNTPATTLCMWQADTMHGVRHPSCLHPYISPCQSCQRALHQQQPEPPAAGRSSSVTQSPLKQSAALYAHTQCAGRARRRRLANPALTLPAAETVPAQKPLRCPGTAAAAAAVRRG